MSQFTIVTRSQTTFTRRERGWYNAYARLVQNPPGTGRSIAFHTLVTGQLAVYNRSLLAKLKQSSYTRLARTLQVVWNGMNSMTEGILRLTVPECSCFSWSAIYARLLGVSRYTVYRWRDKFNLSDEPDRTMTDARLEMRVRELRRELPTFREVLLTSIEARLRPFSPVSAC